MIEYIMWIISFITLYLSIVWINFLYFSDFQKPRKLKNIPTLTIVVPAFNEETGIKETISSLVSCQYPADKLSIVVVDDGSTDKTAEVVRKSIKEHPGYDITLISQENQGKAAAVNAALFTCNSELFACLDADSTIGCGSIMPMLVHFEDDAKTAAVISAIKVDDPKNLFEKIQRFEYLMAILMRKIRSTINTLAMTPGVLSIYRTEVLKDVGGFDVGNITEDFEIAMRLKYHGYNIQLETSAVTYTKVPNTFRMLWRQRLRWFRGYLINHYKYKDMFFSPKHNKLFSCFQLPLNIFSIFLFLFMIVLVSYYSFTFMIERVIRITMIKGYLENLFYVPSLKEFILSQNFKIMIPIYLGSLTGILLFYFAHKISKEKFKYPLSIWAYFVIFPYMSFTHWVFSLTDEVFRRKRKW